MEDRKTCLRPPPAALPRQTIPERLDGVAAIRISLADSLSLAACRNSDFRGRTRLADDLGAAGRAVQEGRANE